MSTDTTTRNRLHAILKGCKLPASESERNRLLTNFEQALAEVSRVYGLPFEETRIIDGHLYSQIELRCPACAKPLSLRSPVLQDNAAFALACCQSCHWSGEAIYRAIDLMVETDSEAGSFPELPYASIVRRGQFRPIYVKY